MHSLDTLCRGDHTSIRTRKFPCISFCAFLKLNLGNNFSKFFSLELPKVPEMDLAFVISATSSSAIVNFAKIKDTVREVIELYGVQKVHYSVILFGRDPTVRIPFTQKYSESALKATIAALPRPTDGSSLHSALGSARGVFSVGGRPDAKKVVVVVLDAESESNIEDVKNAAGMLEDDGIKVIVVAFGDQTDLDQTSAATVNKDNIVRANGTDVPKDIAEEITAKIAKGESLN